MNGKDLYAVYPTATTALLFISVPKQTNISIYNASGILVKRIQLQASQNINVQELSKGVYHLQFEEAKETVRFIKL